MRIFLEFPWGDALNESWVVYDDIFGYLSGYFFGNFREKASVVMWR